VIFGLIYFITTIMDKVNTWIKNFKIVFRVNYSQKFCFRKEILNGTKNRKKDG